MKPTLAMSAGTFASLFLLAIGVAPAHAAPIYTITLQTDRATYSDAQPIKIVGTVSPAPGPNTGVIITVRNPTGSLADINEAFPDPTNGSFSEVSVPGGSAVWVSGTYSINATWGGNGATASKVVTFDYVATATSTSTSRTTTTTTTSFSLTSTSTTTTTTPALQPSTATTSTTTSSTTPEFPTSLLALLALVAMATVAILSKRIMPRPAVYGGP